MAKSALKWIIIALAIAAAFSAAFYYSIKQVEVTGASVSEIKGISISGFTLLGNVSVYNGGFFPIRVDRITYNVTLGEVKGVIGKGEIIGSTVAAGETKDFQLTANIEWVPSISTALELLTANKTYADVKGIVHVVEWKGLARLKIPFSARVNLKDYIVHLVMESPSVELEGVAGGIAGIVGEIAEGMSEEIREGAGMVIGALEEMT